MFSHVAATSPSTSPKKAQIIDEEFGVIAYRRTPQARLVRLRVTEDGVVRASLPKRAPLYMVTELVNSSRAEIRKIIEAQHARRVRYESGMTIGHSHRLYIEHAPVDQPFKKISGQSLLITLPLENKLSDPLIHSYVSLQVKGVLKREAKAYLPRRLRYLADMFGFTYDRERFGNQRGRWGSCSSSGTISLNVALMNLPHDVIDYVLIHELAHTKQMNHSVDFWGIVESCMPDYKERRKILKTMSPIC
jgi:predicted metal-dependent hydrolase